MNIVLGVIVSVANRHLAGSDRATPTQPTTTTVKEDS